MAWIDVHVIYDDFETVSDGRHRGTLKFYCASDTPIDDPADALAANDGTTAVPAYGLSWSPSYPWTVLNQQRVERKSAYQFHVTLTYEDPQSTSGQDAGKSDADLLAEAAEIQESFEIETEEYIQDAQGTMVATAAGEPFEQEPTRERGIKVYTIGKYVNAATKAAIEAALETNNDANVTIRGTTYPADVLYLRTGASFSDVAGHSGIYRAQYAIAFKKNVFVDSAGNPHGWVNQAPNAGYTELDTTTTPHSRKQITEKDADGQDVPVSKPWPLNADGTKKTNSDDPIDTLTFFPYALASWASVPVS